MSSRPPATHPLVGAYLDELDRLLSGIEPAERLEVVEGVREHIDSSLEGTAATEATEADVRAALAEVGPAQAVADEAYAGRRQPAGPTPRPPATSRMWLPVTVSVLQGIALFLVIMTAGGATGYSSSSSVVVGSGGQTSVTSTTEGGAGDDFVGALGGFFVALPFWIVIVVLVGISALWIGRERIALVALVPVSALALGTLPAVGRAVLGESGSSVGVGVAAALCVLGGGAVVWVIVRRACRRAGALVSA